MLRPLLSVGYPQYGGNAPAVEGIWPFEMSVQGCPALRPVENGYHTWIVNRQFSLDG